jgi:hypothetical protein
MEKDDYNIICTNFFSDFLLLQSRWPVTGDETVVVGVLYRRQ